MKHRRDALGAADRWVPLTPVFRHVFEVHIAGEGESSGFRAPARQAGETIGAIANHSEVVRNRFGTDAPLRHYSGFIAHDAAHAVELNDAGAGHALREVLVRS